MQQFLAICLVSLMLVISGCTALQIQEEDSAAVTTGKVVARVLLVVPSFGISELHLAFEREDAARRARWAEEDRRYRAWFERLTPEQQERERDREVLREAAALQAWGLSRQRPPFSMPPVQGYTPPPIQYAPAYQAPPPRPPVNCTTQVIGDIAHTNCY